MKSFIILTLLSLAVAASATPAALAKVSQTFKEVLASAKFFKIMNHGRRLSDEPAYMKFTCAGNVSGIMSGTCSSGSKVPSHIVMATGHCFNVDGVYLTISYTGTNITVTGHENADCSDAGVPNTLVSGECDSDGDYFAIYEGSGIQLEYGDKCSSVADPFGGHMYLAEDECASIEPESFKATCSSDGNITYYGYSDAACSKQIDTGKHPSGECFANPAAASDVSPAARAVPFVFVLLSVILASMLMQ